MKRRTLRPRTNWAAQVEKLGLTFHSPEGEAPYWDESVCYEFTAREVDELEAATAELQRLCLEAGQFILDQERLDSLGIRHRRYFDRDGALPLEVIALVVTAVRRLIMLLNLRLSSSMFCWFL